MKLGKSLGTYTARGIVTEEFTRAGKPDRVRLFDGTFETAYVVKDFYAIPVDFTGANQPDFVLKLATSPNIDHDPALFCDPSDSREIAWAGCVGSNGSWADQASAVDPDNMIVEDLWIYANNVTVDETTPCGYMIVMEKYEITDAQGAIAMSRDRANEPEPEWTFR